MAAVPPAPRRVTKGLPSATPREGLLWGCALALALGLLVTLWLHRDGPLWLEEDLSQRFAFGLWGFDRGRFDPDPHLPFWPHASLYFFFLIQALHYGVGRALGVYLGPADFRAAVVLDPTGLRATAMLAALLLGMSTLWVAGRLARRWLGDRGAVWVLLGLALDPLFLRHSLVLSPDMLLTLCILAGLLSAKNVEERGRLRDSWLGGMWLGLGTACKYSPALLAFPMLLAHLRRPGGRGPGKVLLDSRLWAAAGVALIAFAVSSPYTIADLTLHRREMRMGVEAVTGGHFGTVRLPSFGSYALSVLPGDLGWPLWILLAVSLMWVTFRRFGRFSLLLAFLLPYLMTFGTLPIIFPRYMLPVIPLLFIFGVATAGEMRRFARGRWILVFAGIAAAAGLLARTGEFLSTSLKPDTRSVARAWFLHHVPDRALVATEFLGPSLPARRVYEAVARHPGISPARQERLKRGPSYLAHAIPLSTQTPEVTAPFYDPLLYVDFDWILVSEGVRGRFRGEPERFPVQVDFYRALDGFFARVYRSPDRGVVGPLLEIYRPIPSAAPRLAEWWAERLKLHSLPDLAAYPLRLPRAFAERAMLLEDAQRFVEAIPDWRRALRWPGAPAIWWFHYGVCSEMAADWTRARAAYRNAFEGDSSLVEAGLAWAENAGKLGHWEETAYVTARLLSRPQLGADDRARAARLESAARRSSAAPAR